MSNLIIIRGPLGVGKTTISKHLAERLKGIHIAIDKVLEKHELDKVKGRCIPLQNFIKANKLILPEINKTLAKGKSVIIDGNFYHKGQITHLLKNATQKGTVLTLTAPIKTCIKRDSCRARTYGECAARAVHNLVSGIKHGITINTECRTINQTESRALSIIRKQR
ncbi:MAG: AAA family ATPase [Nanoarchaeota archaeon]